jgi:uncharacterized protein (TIGR03435 family)
MSCAGLLSAMAFSQDTETAAKFEVSDIHVSAPARNQGLRAFVRGGRYELRMATMVDLVRLAYGVDADRVLEGPSWLEMDRFDVLAKGPTRATAEMQRAMLQALLADRFKLVVRKDTRALPAYNLTAGKKPALKKAAGGGQTGCGFNFSGPGSSDGPPAPPMFTYNCRNVTMSAFAETISGMIGVQQYLFNAPVLDKTGLAGAWDFDFKYSLRGLGAAAPGDAITFFDAVEKQLGLKLEAVKVPLPVIVVERVNRKPTDNAPGAAETLRGGEPPTEFEVADVKPSAPDSDRMRFDIKPGGRVNISGFPLRDLIQQAWGLRPDMLIGTQKGLDEDRFDIVAKAPAAAESTELATGAQNGPVEPPQVDFETVQVMLRGLLKDRFKLAMHEEERTVNAYTLVAVKPKMTKADPASRTKFTQGPTANGKSPAPGTRLFTAQNLNMAQFADQLQRMAPGYIQTPVLDATGLDGSYNFTLAFAPAGAARGGGGRGGKRGPAMADSGEPSDPSGVMSLPEAIDKQLGLKLEQQKRQVKVWVIDRVERTPTEN